MNKFFMILFAIVATSLSVFADGIDVASLTTDLSQTVTNAGQVYVGLAILIVGFYFVGRIIKRI
jgi:hypothetical protein